RWNIARQIRPGSRGSSPTTMPARLSRPWVNSGATLWCENQVAPIPVIPASVATSMSVKCRALLRRRNPLAPRTPTVVTFPSGHRRGVCRAGGSARGRLAGRRRLLLGMILVVEGAPLGNLADIDPVGLGLLLRGPEDGFLIQAAVFRGLHGAPSDPPNQRDCEGDRRNGDALS